MDQEINPEIKRICQDWEAKIKRIENSDEGFPKRACERFINNFMDESFRRMME